MGRRDGSRRLVGGVAMDHGYHVVHEAVLDLESRVVIVANSYEHAQWLARTMTLPRFKWAPTDTVVTEGGIRGATCDTFILAYVDWGSTPGNWVKLAVYLHQARLRGARVHEIPFDPR